MKIKTKIRDSFLAYRAKLLIAPSVGDKYAHKSKTVQGGIVQMAAAGVFTLAESPYVPDKYAIYVRVAACILSFFGFGRSYKARKKDGIKKAS